VDTKSSDKKAEKKSYKPILFTGIGISHRRLIDGTSTFYADNGIVVDLCTTISAKHIAKV
jgi:hypothetical protein